MSETYGKEVKFVAFEVQIGERFMKVPYAKEICDKLGIEFVHYEEIDADPELIDKLANAPSVQAQRNGVENPKLPREGVVLRPLFEFLHPDGVGRIMAKHKNDIYKEREHAPKIQSQEDLKVLEDAKAIAQEWVTPMRLVHVLDKLAAGGMVIEEKRMNDIIAAMVEDIEREAKGEIISNKQTRKAISQRTAKLMIENFKSQI
jgi:site-specific recombinase XerD